MTSGGDVWQRFFPFAALSKRVNYLFLRRLCICGNISTKQVSLSRARGESQLEDPAPTCPCGRGGPADSDKREKITAVLSPDRTAVF